MNGASFGRRMVVVFARRALARLGVDVTWRLILLVCMLGMIGFSAMIIVLQVMPSWKTTFTATFETQRVQLRIAGHQALLEGISASRIRIRERHSADAAEADPSSFDLTTLSARPDEIDLNVAVAAPDTTLELDSLRIPAGRALEISGMGAGQALLLTVADDETAARVDAAVVWDGPVSVAGAEPKTNGLGVIRWNGASPVLDIDKAHMGGVSLAPIQVSAISLEHIQFDANSPLPGSAIVKGDIQFDIAGEPTASTAIREGESIEFGNLSARFMNFAITDKGVRFVLVGRADDIRAGHAHQRRSLHPTMLTALRTHPSLSVILPAIFTLVLALLGAMSLDRRESER